MHKHGTKQTYRVQDEKHVNILVIAAILLPSAAICQLWFNLNLDEGIDFGEVMVDEAEQRVLVANLVEGESWVRWWFSMHTKQEAEQTA